MINPAGSDMAADKQVMQRMLLSLKHRGPDDSGIWQDNTRGVTLGHVRLSILDLSAAGHQPMVSDSGMHVLS